jgi:restriction system protein
MAEESRLPTAAALMWPTLQVLREGAGSMSNEQIELALASALQLPDVARQQMHRDTNRTEIGYRAAWARTRLRTLGYLESAGRASWRLTRLGSSVSLETFLSRG